MSISEAECLDIPNGNEDICWVPCALLRGEFDHRLNLQQQALKQQRSRVGTFEEKNICRTVTRTFWKSSCYLSNCVLFCGDKWLSHLPPPYRCARRNAFVCTHISITPPSAPTLSDAASVWQVFENTFMMTCQANQTVKTIWPFQEEH